jgi:ATP-binding cassette subfamily B protein
MPPSARICPGSLESQPEPAEENSPVVEARDLTFRYSDRAEPVLRGANLQIAAGDRVVLEGASGGGKSTLVSICWPACASPAPAAFSSDGLDRKILGAAEWRRRLAAAPQFHENHVLAETFAFNLFLGRPTVLGAGRFRGSASHLR